MRAASTPAAGAAATGEAGSGGSAAPAPRFPIRLVALDIDGTLVGPDLVLHERTRAAIGAAVRRGVAVSLVTGRMASSAVEFARQLELVEPIVAAQGGIIRAMPRAGSRRVGRLLHHRPLPAAVGREIIEWTRERGLDPHVNHLERFIIRADDPLAEDYSRFLGADAELVPDLLVAISHPVTKVIAVGDEPLPESLLLPAREHFAGRADATISHPRFLEFVAPGVSKGWAVRWLARRARIPLGQVVAIGDQYNDLEMIASVGHGVAMASAPEAVRAVARMIALPVEEEGAAGIIEELVLGRVGPRIAGVERVAS